jgi:valyl-tRNA synthetase
MLERYSADAVRYWAASTGFGKDAVINEEKIKNGQKLATKLWNVARFCEPFLVDFELPEGTLYMGPSDRWLLARLARLIQRVTELMQGYEYAAAKSEIESFFWRDLADNYLELCKGRLYDQSDPERDGARYTLYYTLLAVLQLFAPFLPYVTEEIYRGLYAERGGQPSLHLTAWPTAEPFWTDAQAEIVGETLIEVATAVRRYKSENSLSLGAQVGRLLIVADEPALANELIAAGPDLFSVTRAKEMCVGIELNLENSLTLHQRTGVLLVALTDLAE